MLPLQIFTRTKTAEGHSQCSSENRHILRKAIHNAKTNSQNCGIDVDPTCGVWKFLVSRRSGGFGNIHHFSCTMTSCTFKDILWDSLPFSFWHGRFGRTKIKLLWRSRWVWDLLSPTMNVKPQEERTAVLEGIAIRFGLHLLCVKILRLIQ